MKKKLDIKEIQKLQLDMLIYIDDICKKENIRYFLAFGSLLGAVREKGFIAWDDDIDLYFFKDDLEKLSRVIYKYKNDSFFFQDMLHDKYCITPDVTRLCVNGTFAWPDEYQNAKFHTGLYLDLFPLYYVNDEKFELKKKKKLMAIHKFILLKKKPFRTLKGKKSVIAKIIAIFIPYKVWNALYNYVIKNKIVDSSDKIVCYPGYADIFYKSDWFSEVTYLPFEGRKFPCPIGYDAYLKLVFGDDYMIPKQMKDYTNNVYAID